jgi:hypothetical protein
VGTVRARCRRRVVGLRVVLLVVAVAIGGGIALAAGLSGAGAKSYSAYDDPQKPVLSFVLSDDRNVEDLQREFGLSDERVREILAVVRDEDSALDKEYEESERIVEASQGASEAKIKEKIAGSDFDEKVKRAVARTKSEVEGLLPDGRARDLEPWVNERWRTETATYEVESEATYRASSTGYSCGVYASYYTGNTRYEVALPHKKVKFSGGHRVRITDVGKGTRARAPVKETGPWNIRDNYWRASRDRSMWRDLPRCMPEAEAAFFDNYNGGKDQFGRVVRNPAGLDMTLAVARRMEIGRKIQRRGIIKVRVFFPWVSR